jgi:hypothetical protein
MQELDIDVASALLSRALQEALCGERQKALRDMSYWPAVTRARAKHELAEAIEDADPQLAKELTGQSHE